MQYSPQLLTTQRKIAQHSARLTGVDTVVSGAGDRTFGHEANTIRPGFHGLKSDQKRAGQEKSDNNKHFFVCMQNPRTRHKKEEQTGKQVLYRAILVEQHSRKILKTCETLIQLCQYPCGARACHARTDARVWRDAVAGETHSNCAGKLSAPVCRHASLPGARRTDCDCWAAYLVGAWCGLVGRAARRSIAGSSLRRSHERWRCRSWLKV